MAFLQANIYSNTLGMELMIDVILPQQTYKKFGSNSVGATEDVPVLYLLHGMGGNHSVWQRRTSIERYVKDLGIAVIMPSTDLAWYTDTQYDMKYWTFISEELPQLCHELFPQLTTNREKTFAAGLSMGGFGALKLGLLCPEKFAGIADFITYFPFDIPQCTNKFLKKLHPDVVLIAETELWPNFAHSCREMNIPLLTVNGRISDSTFKSYKLAGIFFKQVFKDFTALLMQSREDAKKVLTLGADKEKVEVMGNLKFDVQRKDADIDLKHTGSRVIIAGSTHKGEDEIVISAFKALKKDFADIKLLIAPRHLQRTNDVAEIVKSAGFAYGLRSANDNFQEKDVIILDTLGELGKMYSICDFAFIGGSFNKTGGHNPLEAAVYNKPVLSGPSIHNFKDIYEMLSRSNAGKVVKSQEELEQAMRKLLSDKEFYFRASADCESVFAAQKGALDFVIQKLHSLLK